MVIISFGVPKILMIKAELLRILLITTDFAFITQKLPRTYTQPLAHRLLKTFLYASLLFSWTIAGKFTMTFVEEITSQFF